jgi:DNA-binding response OmpR family regulator
MLPGMDGLELCRRLRRGGLGVPAVIMSAWDDLASQIGPAGADGYLVQPFALDLLLATLRSLPTTSRAASRWGSVAGSSAQ